MTKESSMTFQEAREYAKKNKEKAFRMLKSAPAFSMEDIPELDGFVPGKRFRGFAAFKEHINRNGRPKAEDPKVGVSVRIPLSYAAELRATGPGWQTRISEYLIKGIKKGDLVRMAAA